MTGVKTVQIPFNRTKDGVIINVKVQPRSSKKEIAGVSGDTLKVRLTSAPVDNAANEQLIEVLSEELNIKKSSIHIMRGSSSRQKVIKIEGVDEILWNKR